jgi:hypothetical protein
MPFLFAFAWLNALHAVRQKPRKPIINFFDRMKESDSDDIDDEYSMFNVKTL